MARAHAATSSESLASLYKCSVCFKCFAFMGTFMDFSGFRLLSFVLKE